jgi:hypothetical protein
LSRVTLNIKDSILAQVDSNKKDSGLTRTAVIERILTQHYEEQEEQQRLYDAWLVAEVEKGMKSARERPLISHEDALKRLHVTLERARMQNAAKVV